MTSLKRISPFNLRPTTSKITDENITTDIVMQSVTSYINLSPIPLMHASC